jgi:RNase P subunit RPR2
MSTSPIERRPAQREAFCRGCDKEIVRGTDMIYTYSRRNRGQHIHFCLQCAVEIGKLAEKGKS